jgi:hypothetical protein
MKVLFPDTNLFLQCNPIEQLSWEEISMDDILLLISRPVQSEIDELKQSGNSRKAQRARTATSLFRQILKENNIVIKGGKPHAEISFSPHVNQDNFSDYNLNPSRPDDQIVFEALIYRENHKEYDIALLTHDTGPAVTAKSVGLPCIIIPDEWLLPPETDLRDKRINELERRIKELEKTYPQIEINFLDTDDEIINFILIKLPKYQSITEAQISSIMETLKTKFPMATNFNVHPNVISQDIINSLTAKSLRPTQEQIDQYTNKDYPKWLENVEELLRTLHTRLDLKFRNIRLFMSMSNVGNVPAEDLIVDFALYNGFLLPSPSEFLNEEEPPQNISLAFPNPPPAPKAKFSTRGILSFPFDQLPPTDLLTTNFMSGLGQHDKYGFYWTPNKPAKMTNRCTLECDEFRHQTKAEVFELSLHFPPDFTQKKTALETTVTAKNLPKPVKSVLPIEIEHITEDASEYAYSLIDGMKPK